MPPAPTHPAAPTPGRRCTGYHSLPRIVNANAEQRGPASFSKSAIFRRPTPRQSAPMRLSRIRYSSSMAGQAHRKAEQRKEALEMYQRYL